MASIYDLPVHNVTPDEHAKGKELSDSGEVINDCSIGINRILNWFASQFEMVNKTNYDVYFINIMTLVRNCYNKDLSDIEIQSLVDKDISQLKTYISTYSQSSLSPVAVLFYLPSYQGLSVHKREITGNNLRIENITEGLKKIIPSKLTNISVDNTKIYVIALDNSLPHKQLSKLSKTISDKGTRANVLLLSHCPADFHLYKTIYNLSLIESYTAEIVPAKKFGAKVFKVDNMPFNEYIHLTLGDSINIRPLAIRKDKERVIEISIKRNWKVRTNSEILNDLVTLCKMNKVMLTTLKF